MLARQKAGEAAAGGALKLFSEQLRAEICGSDYELDIEVPKRLD
jgi:hypothetical protein